MGRLTAEQREDRAEALARQMQIRQVDLNEARKLLHFLVHSKGNLKKVDRYLEVMAEHPPPRSQRTKRQYRALRECWTSLRNQGLEPEANHWIWGQAIRIACTRQRL